MVTFYEWLVDGLEPWNFMTFHPVGNVIIPSDEVIFLRGVGIPPTSTYIHVYIICHDIQRYDVEWYTVSVPGTPTSENIVVCYVSPGFRWGGSAKAPDLSDSRGSELGALGWISCSADSSFQLGPARSLGMPILTLATPRACEGLDHCSWYVRCCTSFQWYSLTHEQPNIWKKWYDFQVSTPFNTTFLNGFGMNLSADSEELCCSNSGAEISSPRGYCVRASSRCHRHPVPSRANMDDFWGVRSCLPMFTSFW